MIEQLNHYGRLWIGFFGPAVIQNTVFVGLVLVVLHYIRNVSARVRYCIGVVGLFKLLIPPMFRLPQLVSASRSFAALPETLTGIALIPAPSGTGIPAEAQPSLDMAGMLVLLWAVCVLVYLFASCAGTIRLALALRHAVPLAISESTVDGEVAGVRLYRSDRITMPLSLGVFPRRIFVPPSWDGWSAECRAMVVRHELAHIDRWDGLFQVFQIAAQALYWFHPLVWLLNRRLGEYREMACDDASVGGEKSSSVAYSRYLVEIAESMMRDPASCRSASALIRRKNELLNRVRYQMKEGVMMQMTRAKAAMLVAALALLILPLSWHFGDTRAEDPGGGVRTAHSRPPFETGGAPPGRSEAERKGDRGGIEIRIDEGDVVSVNGTVTDFDLLEESLKRETAGMDEDPVITLICDPNVTMGAIYRLQNVLRELDLMKMNYFTMEGEGLPLELPPLDIEERLAKIPREHIAVIVIGAGDTPLILGGEAFEPSATESVVQKLLAANPALIVWIRAAEEARYGDFVTVLEEVKKAGAMRILVNGDGKGFTEAVQE